MIELVFEDVPETDAISVNFLQSWLAEVCTLYNRELQELTFIFCSDDYLLEINKQHLNHDYYTDIITFDYCEGNFVAGDLFISIDRVNDNAASYKQSFKDELHRVCVHGVLHLCGLKDKSDDDSKTMRLAEDEMLKRRMFHVEHLKS
jgi:rRNA maturation RNase YbeY